MVKTPSGLSSQGNMVHSHTFPELCSQDAGDSFCLEEYADHDAGVDSEVCDPRFAAIAAEHAGSWKLPFSRSEEYARLREDTFVSLLLRNHCHEVARLNYDFECPEQKGYEKAFGENSIRLKKIPFVDGNIPNKEVVKEFLKSSGNAIKQNKTIALHCQGGMGRTERRRRLSRLERRLSLDGRLKRFALMQQFIIKTAFHGWTRICRPGTVQTVIQEEFLRKMQPNISRASCGKSLMERMRMRFSSV
eukprot:g16880.t1